MSECSYNQTIATDTVSEKAEYALIAGKEYLKTGKRLA